MRRTRSAADRRRSVRGLSTRPGARRRPRSSTRADAVTCSLGGLSKSVGLPQLKLGWIGFGGPATRLDGSDGGLRGGCRHLPVGVDAGAAGAARRCSRAALTFGGRSRTRTRRNLGRAPRGGCQRAGGDGPDVRGRMVGGPASAGGPQRGIAGPRAADRRSRARASRVLLRSSNARRFSWSAFWSSPAVFDRGDRAGAGTRVAQSELVL